MNRRIWPCVLGLSVLCLGVSCRTAPPAGHSSTTAPRRAEPQRPAEKTPPTTVTFTKVTPKAGLTFILTNTERTLINKGQKKGGAMVWSCRDAREDRNRKMRIKVLGLDGKTVVKTKLVYLNANNFTETCARRTPQRGVEAKRGHQFLITFNLKAQKFAFDYDKPRCIYKQCSTVGNGKKVPSGWYLILLNQLLPVFLMDSWQKLIPDRPIRLGERFEFTGKQLHQATRYKPLRNLKRVSFVLKKVVQQNGRDVARFDVELTNKQTQPLRATLELDVKRTWPVSWSIQGAYRGTQGSPSGVKIHTLTRFTETIHFEYP